MEPLGPKLAEGRDSEIFEHGPGRVLRVTKRPRSLVGEAALMRHVRDHGYPCPRVLDAGDSYLVMERLVGPTMLAAAGRPPFPLRRFGRLLAELHQQLHRIPAPDGLVAGPVPGDRVVHRDLHPANVLMTSGGPVVIDWANAASGDPAGDVAETWALFAAADPPVGGLDRLLVPLGRRIMLRAFLGGVDVAAARRALPAVVEARAKDPNMSPAELARMRRLAGTGP